MILVSSSDLLSHTHHSHSTQPQQQACCGSEGRRPLVSHLRDPNARSVTHHLCSLHTQILPHWPQRISVANGYKMVRYHIVYIYNALSLLSWK